MNIKNNLTLYIVLAVLLVITSPVLVLVYAFGASAGLELLSNGNSEGIGMLLFGLLPLLPVCFVLIGLVHIIQKKHHDTGTIARYSFLAWGIVLLLHILSVLFIFFQRS